MHGDVYHGQWYQGDMHGKVELTRKKERLRRRCVMLYAIFLKSLNVSLHQLNSKNNDPGLLFKRIFMHLSCLLSSVATGGQDGHVLKLFYYHVCKNHQENPSS